MSLSLTTGPPSILPDHQTKTKVLVRRRWRDPARQCVDEARVMNGKTRKGVRKLLLLQTYLIQRNNSI